MRTKILSTVGMATALSLQATIIASAPLEIPPAPILWAMPRQETYDSGVAEFLASRELDLCMTCTACEFESLAISFSNPGPYRISGCAIVQDSLIETRPLETIRLESIGSTVTVPIFLPEVVFQTGSLGAQNFLCLNRRRSTFVRLLETTGNMTIQRTSEAGGYFSLAFEVFIEVWLHKATSPNYTLVTKLGPYPITLEKVPWSWQAATSSLCQDCAGDFNVMVEGSPGDPFLLQGHGTTPSSSVHLDESLFALPLRPICAARITAIQKTSWATVKELMR